MRLWIIPTCPSSIPWGWAACSRRPPVLSACPERLSGSGAHSVLRPAGVQAARIHDLWQLTLWICMGVFASILIALLVALMRARPGAARVASEKPRSRAPTERAARRWITGRHPAQLRAAGRVARHRHVDRSRAFPPARSRRHCASR
jgi:hypothetical protein